MQETWVRSLGQEDTLEKGMATHPRILAWRIPWKEEPGGLQCTGCKESDTTEYKHKQAQYMCGSPVLKEKRNLWNNRLVQNWERSTSRLYIVILLI